jgi:tetratricopeptide (TPR) repeat protein
VTTGAPPLKAGDLDNIILMAMHKDPARRYSSVAELSEDLRRYVENLPVRAREDTLFYRARKFTRRHSTVVAAGALLLATLAGGVTVSTIEGRRAQRRFNDVRSIAHAVLYDVYDAIRDLQGSTKAREAVVKTALQYLNGLAREAAGDPDIQLELAQAYLRVGDVQGNAFSSSLGKTDEALETYRKATKIADELARRHPGAKNDLVRMEARQQIADILATKKLNFVAAREIYREGIAIGETVTRNNPADREGLKQLASLYLSVARENSNSAAAIATGRKALPILEFLTAGGPRDDEEREALSDAYSILGSGLMNGNELEEALQCFRKSVHLREPLAAAHPDNMRFQRDLMISYSKMGDLLGPILPSLEDPKGALENYRKMLAISEKLAAADRGNPRVEFDHGMALVKIGNAFLPEEGDAAMRALGEARAIFESRPNGAVNEQMVRYGLGSVSHFMALRQQHAGDMAGAMRSYREAIRINEALLANGTPHLQLQRALWIDYQELGKAQATLHQRADALDSVRKAVAAAETARSIDPSNAVTQSLLPQAYATEGGIRARFAGASGAPTAQRREDWTEARTAFQRSADGWEQIHPQRGWPKDRDTQLSHSRAEASRCAASLAALR